MKPVLKKDTLAELTTDELALVNGGAPWTPSCHLFIELRERLSDVAC
ncbi:MAG TPA: bacteriocin [Frankiaceae bacterium]|nr:bacteriocin [Frankiaceae bacterium]